MTIDKPTHVAFNIVPVTDGIKFTLSYSHRAFLKFIGANGGDISFNWETLKTLSTQKAVDHERILIDDMKLIEETPIIGIAGEVRLRLTDTGRNILTLILKSES